MPFCTGSVLEVENEVLLAAFGLLLPGLMHEAVPESTATIWASPPRPASFAWTVRVFPETVTVGELTKCGLPADAGSARASVANSVLRSAPVIVRSRRMTPPCVWGPRQGIPWSPRVTSSDRSLSWYPVHATRIATGHPGPGGHDRWTQVGTRARRWNLNLQPATPANVRSAKDRGQKGNLTSYAYERLGIRCCRPTGGKEPLP